ncbi:hypothetical protein XELAEV_180043622mg, partial [Xenopus laevis]
MEILYDVPDRASTADSVI